MEKKKCCVLTRKMIPDKKDDFLDQKDDFQYIKSFL